jgi:hypothetical protein
MSPSPFLTLEEAAEYVRMSAYSLGEKCRHGIAPHRKPSGGRRLLFPRQRAGRLGRWGRARTSGSTTGRADRATRIEEGCVTPMRRRFRSSFLLV